MKMISVWTALPIALAAYVPAAYAQTTTQRPNHIPTAQQQNGPFGTQWAKPPGTTGSQIYNDPRMRDPNSSNKTQRSKPCPAPALYDPASGGCR